MNLNILVLPGDGIGTEVTGEAVRVLRRVAEKWNHQLKLKEGLLGGIAIHKTGTPFPRETEQIATQVDATLLGAVGLPEFDAAPPHLRPERGLLGIRKAMRTAAPTMNATTSAERTTPTTWRPSHMPAPSTRSPSAIGRTWLKTSRRRVA